ncbi:MipA/OmpV family protein [Zoogloea sp.]|uniref:MipA/OmpV family protein n=1 Tax=Zoogloea sp. TaxID=49181 RepID=UPI002639FC75|nr:MipA/OmpV family protein [Zoogloea sp.]MDD3354326.1 MipA/OmpV family protein [Zoogloea sp.]
MTHARHLYKPLLGTLLLLGAHPLLASERIDRQTETAIPRTGNLYGLGIGVLPATSGSDELRTMVLPVIQASFGDRFYINALRAGVWLLDSEDKRVRLGLSADARFGWEAEDGRRTKGMQDRDFAVDVGPTLRWQTDYGTLNAQWGFDATSASNGQSAQVQFVRALIRGQTLRLNGLVGVTWNNRKMNDYYFGVAPAEAAPGRPAYRAGSGTQLQAGINGAWSTGGRGSVLFGVMLNRLGGAQADSPIVETRIQPLAYAGYGWTF